MSRSRMISPIIGSESSRRVTPLKSASVLVPFAPGHEIDALTKRHRGASCLLPASGSHADFGDGPPTTVRDRSLQPAAPRRVGVGGCPSRFLIAPPLNALYARRPR